VRSYNQPECCGTAPSDPDDVGEARPHVVERPPQAIEPIRTRTELPSPPALLDSQWKTLYLVKALLKADSDKVLASYWIREQNTLTHRIHVTHKASSCRTVRTSGKTFIVLFLFVLVFFCRDMSNLVRVTVSLGPEPQSTSQHVRHAPCEVGESRHRSQ
jgi:Na+-transporting methylmalonyl-CoA/oxaloacetate decarboxylase gamma subunit